ncbi:LysR family transcriptional regulator [Caulobacter endophyticus]|uniref:HTH lysR-type domain-containing protein n=1 Tax=Caulobacter endophyticus TaxID=2172652 RepID=A0A2T9JGW6_9CAUL|nr:LysR family transcriptional regulator [Caulobacter endophyticus]PVM82915.1 hypothetical protein DDF67_21755 [Caulobacter endophyticus]
MRIRLTLPQIEAFLKLTELGSFRDAATALGVSQPAFSRTIQLIEGRIGARLFDRDTRNVTLTAAGEHLRPLAERLLKTYDEAFDELDQFIGGRQGRVRIAALPSVAAAVLPAAIKEFQSKHPEVQIDIWEDVSGPVHRAVAAGEADIGLATPPPAQSDLRYRALMPDELVLVCRHDDPLTAGEVYPWSVLADRPFIGMSADSSLHGLIDAAFKEADLAIKPLFNCKQPTTIGSLVAEGLGLSVLPRLTLAQIASPALTWRRLETPTIARSIGMITHAAHSPSPAGLLFSKAIERAVRRSQAA